MKVYVVTKCFIERDGCPTENVAVFRSRKDAEALVKEYEWAMGPERIYEVEEWEVK